MNLSEYLKGLSARKFLLLAVLAAFWMYGLVDNYLAGHTMAYLACSAAAISAFLTPWRSVGKSIGKLIGLSP